MCIQNPHCTPFYFKDYLICFDFCIAATVYPFNLKSSATNHILISMREKWILFLRKSPHQLMKWASNQTIRHFSLSLYAFHKLLSHPIDSLYNLSVALVIFFLNCFERKPPQELSMRMMFIKLNALHVGVNLYRAYRIYEKLLHQFNWNRCVLKIMWNGVKNGMRGRERAKSSKQIFRRTCAKIHRKTWICGGLVFFRLPSIKFIGFPTFTFC